jgi:putative protease
MELLSPAGTPEALDAAIASGADAVYLGLKSFNARLRSANFAYSQFEALVKTLHRQNRKIYVTVNTVFEEREADRMYQLLKYLAVVGPDALIVQDYGVVEMVRRFFPSLKLHASTQMNIASARGVNFLSKYDISRVVLARELTITELKSIRENTNVELEVFVHGALCVSVSGLCLFSSYLGGKSANRGMCTQACRRLYRTGESPEDPSENGYFFSPRDLQLIDRTPLLYEAGINALKIEGRMKSAEYVGTVTRAYRLVIDACVSGGEAAIHDAVAEAQGILRGDYARRKTRFHFDGAKADAQAETGIDAETAADAGYLDAEEDGGTGIRLGIIKKKRGSGIETAAFIAIHAYSDHAVGGVALSLGDSLRFHRADDSRRATYKVSFTTPEKNGVWVSAPEGFEPGDVVYLVQRKTAARRYTPLLPKNLDGFRKMPGRDKAPEIDLATVGKKEAALFPPGLYVAVENAADLYAVQPIKTAAVILPFKEKNITALTGKQAVSLPYAPREIIINMPPYYPESQAGTVGAAGVAEEGIRRLAEKGYTKFIVNNPAQTASLKKVNATLIAGPYLYAFNRYSAAFLQNAGFSFFVSPFENSRQNLERTYGGKTDPRAERSELSRMRNLRAPVFLTVYVQPKLFQIADNLRKNYDFNAFFDKEGGVFHLVADDNSQMSYVVPDTPFSLIDKIPFLKAAGWNRFILDFTPRPVKKFHYKHIMQAAAQADVVPCTRFNWKNGFYQPKDPAN